MKRRYQVAVCIYALVLLWLMCAPQPLGDLPGELELSDVVGHLVAYGGFALTISMGIWRSGRELPVMCLLRQPAVLSASYGLILECAQIAMPMRTFEWKDVLMNTVGALLAQWFFCLAVGAHPLRWHKR